jgi:hypothetical protein
VACAYDIRPSHRPQTVVFKSSVYHPLIDPSSHICDISAEFPSWEYVVVFFSNQQCLWVLWVLLFFVNFLFLSFMIFIFDFDPL